MMIVNKSSNAKTGPITCTYRSFKTCPPNCPAKDSCYGKTSFCGMFGKQLDKKTYTNDWKQLKEAFSSFKPETKIRHHVIGDICTKGKIDLKYLRELIFGHRSRPDILGWVYTHAWKLFTKNPALDLTNLTINASCDSIKDIKSAKFKGFDTTIIMPENSKSLTVIKNEKILICPAQRNNKTCKDCLICSVKGRLFTVGFKVHGVKKNNYNFSDKLK